MTLLDDTLALVRVNSISGGEAELASLIHDRLARCAHLDVERVGDNVVARTTGHHRRRLIVAGHLDTVPGDPSAARIDQSRLVGLGACDMKGSLAVMLRHAAIPRAMGVELTWIFYAREEVARTKSGLLELAELRPELLVGDAAILAEPTSGAVEAGCQGTLRLDVTVRGARAHTARPFMGENAIHRLGEVIKRIANYEPRTVEIDGVNFTEQIQVVAVTGGIAGNVVPDVATVTINHRVAPDRSRDEAAHSVRELLGDSLRDGDEFTVVDWAPSAPPALAHDLLSALVAASGVPPRGKLGWTDVATFAERGVPAANFGAGDPLLAHHADECVTIEELESFNVALDRYLAAL